MTGQLPDDFAIRLATVNDTQELASLHLATWRGAYKGIMPEKFLAELSTFEFEESWRKSLKTPGHINFVCKRHGQITGVVSVGPCRDSDCDPRLTAELYAIYLLPELWGKGLGWALWLAVRERLTKSPFVAIRHWIVEMNVRAKKFCERNGFVLDLAAKRGTTHEGLSLYEIGYSLTLR